MWASNQLMKLLKFKLVVLHSMKCLFDLPDFPCWQQTAVFFVPAVMFAIDVSHSRIIKATHAYSTKYFFLFFFLNGMNDWNVPNHTLSDKGKITWFDLTQGHRRNELYTCNPTPEATEEVEKHTVQCSFQKHIHVYSYCVPGCNTTKSIGNVSDITTTVKEEKCFFHF